MFKSHGTVLSVVLKGISVHGAELLQSVLTQPRRTWCNTKEDINPLPIIHKQTSIIFTYSQPRCLFLHFAFSLRG